MEEKLLDIINYYGLMKQLKYMKSEQFELDEAIIRYNMAKTDNELMKEERWDLEKFKKDITGEVADNFVMLMEIIEFLELDKEEIKEIYKYKIDRQIKRIEEETEPSN